jgi:hypothetical protein
VLKRTRACFGGLPCSECRRFGYSAEECRGGIGGGENGSFRKGDGKEKRGSGGLDEEGQRDEGLGGTDVTGRVGKVV